MKRVDSLNRSRRNFLKTGLKAGMAIPILGYSARSYSQESISGVPLQDSLSTQPLKILILGGTGFLGPHQVHYALKRGHSVSIFNRGRTKPTIYQDQYKDVEHLKGFRESDLESLEGGRWDAVIDNSGKQAEWTRNSAELLCDSVGQYLYTSSTGVYYPYLGSDISEKTAPVLETPEGISSFQASSYEFGVMKANSEIEAIKSFGKDRTTIVRPTYMMGPADKTDRFGYWPVRLSRGGEVMIPGMSGDPVQYIDIRDVAKWMIKLIENRGTGTYNAVGPASATSIQEFVYGAHAAFSSAISYIKIDDHKFLRENGVRYAIPWIMPLDEDYGTARINNQHAIANGLEFTPLAESIRDIYNWWYSDAVAEHRREKLISGPRSLMTREADIIEAWRVYKES